MKTEQIIEILKRRIKNESHSIGDYRQVVGFHLVGLKESADELTALFEQELAALKSQAKELSDEDIKAWAKNPPYDPSYFAGGGTMAGRIYGAKAHRDGLIKKQ